MSQTLDQKLLEFHQHPQSASGKKPRILDIGGWFAPCRQATHMVDIMPFETMNVAGSYGYGEMQVRRENYHQLDLGKIERLPFGDQEFDFVVCRHTLEDIKDPLKICAEMIRVSKAGYVETPHRAYESTKGVERHWWCGHYHHRWLVEIQGNRVIFQFKPHNLHSSRKFHFRCWPWQKVRDAFKNTGLMWSGGFEYEERVIIDYGDLKKQLSSYKDSLSGEKLKRLRWAQD